MTLNFSILSGPAGAVDEETFLTAFEDVPQLHLFSNKDLEDQMKVIKDTIGDDKKDWKQRMDSVSCKVFICAFLVTQITMCKDCKLP